MRSLRHLQMDLFAPGQVTPGIPAQLQPKLLTLIQEMLREAMAASAAREEIEQTGRAVLIERPRNPKSQISRALRAHPCTGSGAEETWTTAPCPTA